MANIIAAPSIFCRLSTFSLTIITQSFAGHLGQHQLAAISIVTTVIISITFGFLLGMASVLEMLCSQVYGGKQYHMLGIYLQRSWAFTGLWDFFELSLASGVMLSLENFYFRMLVIVSGIKGAEVAVDALSICISFYGWESMIPLGLFAATGIRVAYVIGAGNEKSAKFAAKVSVFNSLIIGFISFTMIIAFPNKIAMIFTSSSSVISMVEGLALLLAITILFNCIRPILSGWLLDLVAYINVGSCYFVGVPLGIILGWYLHFGLKGIWCGMICGTIIQTLILTIIAVRYPWERRQQAHIVSTQFHDKDERHYK